MRPPYAAPRRRYSRNATDNTPFVVVERTLVGSSPIVHENYIPSLLSSSLPHQCGLAAATLPLNRGGATRGRPGRCYRRSIEETRKVSSRDKELAALVTDTLIETRELVRSHPRELVHPISTRRVTP